MSRRSALRIAPLLSLIVCLSMGALIWGAAGCSWMNAHRVSGTYTLILATLAPNDSPWAEFLKRYQSRLEARSGGILQVKLMLGGALGDENESLTKTARGQIQGFGGSVGALASRIPELNLIELPFLFESAEEADSILETVIEPVAKKLMRERGLTLAFWNENGFRHFASRDHAILTPLDLAGKKMRAQENPVHLAMYHALEAAAVPLPATEVLQSLATGNVDGFDQALLYAVSAGWHRSIRHLTLSRHIYQAAAIVFSAEWWDTLPASLQDLIQEENKLMQPAARQLIRRLQPHLLQKVKQDGVQVAELTPNQRRDFERKMAPVYIKFRQQFGPSASELLNQTQNKLKHIRAQRLQRGESVR